MPESSSEIATSSGMFGEILLVLSDNSGIIKVNQAVFDKNIITDVITLSYPALPGQTSDRAEIIVNIELAVEEGHIRSCASSELALYIAHGCDHLSGSEDNTPARRKRMLQREQQWVEKAKTLGLFPDL